VNANEYLTMAAMTKHYHVGTGHCASAHVLNNDCMGTLTTRAHVEGHTKAAGYNATRRAVDACHKYGETLHYWVTQYRAAIGGNDLPDSVIDNHIEAARRARYETATA
jgi:hypothetical protein